MGFLHEGHAALVRRAKAESDVTAVSIFVNPTQFGPNEDFSTYPRDLVRDRRLCESLGVDFLFTPTAESMYPPDFAAVVRVSGLQDTLCGANRPGHFDGVAQVVTKLLNLACADVAVFGEKDFQQLAIIRRLVADLNIPTRIVGHPTVREPDGLAMSSRNARLTPDDRAVAPAVFAGLCTARERFAAGERDAQRLTEVVKMVYATALPHALVDYIALVDMHTLIPLTWVEDAGLLAVAVRLGAVRLIDNMTLTTEPSPSGGAYRAI